MRNRFWVAPFVALAMVFSALGSGGCSAGDDTAPPVPLNAPGTTAFNDDIHCKVDSDCKAAESCTNGLCQMKRCAANGLTANQPPLGVHGFIKLNRELVVGGGSTVAGYNTSGSSVSKLGSVTPGGTLVDLAGGNLTGVRPESVATATTGSTQIKVTQNGNVVSQFDAGIQPIAMAAGDFTGEGLDRVLVAASNGQFAICNAVTKSCDLKFNLGVSGVRDVAVGDVDADGFDEALFDLGDKVVIFNYDNGKPLQAKTITTGTGRNFTRITAGDIDGDGFDELIGLQDDGSGSSLHVLALSNGSFTEKSTLDVDGGTQDIQFGGIGRDAKDIIAVGGGNHVWIYDGKPDGTLTSAFNTTMTTDNVSRVGASDIDGDNVPAKLIAPPKVSSGNLIPIAVLVPPPYSKQYSGEGHGDSRSVVTMGSSSTTGTGSDHSVTVSYGYGITLGGSIGPLFTASASYNIQKSITTTKSYSKSSTVSQSFSFEARPDLDGYETGAVAVACGCFNQFDYQIDDPNNTLGPDGGDKKVSVFLPIGGQTSVWALKRYNQLAQALGDGSLPTFTIDIKSGDISSYPQNAQKLDGSKIPEADDLFPNSPPFRVSDVASTSFALTLSDAMTTATNTSSGWTLNLSLGAAAVTGNANYGKTISDGYHVDLAKSTTFSGSVPPLRDNPSTPEDEFAINSYSFTPVVYSEHYMTPQKKDATYWVVTYTVGR